MRINLLNPLWIRSVVACVLISVSIANTSNGQSITVRPSSGFESGALLSIRRDPGVINHTKLSGFGTSYDNSLWLGFDIEAHELLGPDWSTIARIGIGFTSGSFVSQPYRGYATSQFYPNPVETQLEFEVASTQTNIHLDILGAWSPMSHALLVGGPWMKVRASSATIATERIIDTGQIFFQGTTTKEQTIGAGKGIESFPLHAGALAGAGYDIILSRSIAIRPMISTRCDAQALLSGLGSRAFSLEGSISMKLDFTSDDNDQLPRIAEPIDTSAVLKAQSGVKATVDIFNLDSSAGTRDIAIAKVQRTSYRQYTPLPPAIYFDVDSDAIRAEYDLYSSNSDAMEGITITRTEPVANYNNLLNLLGRRLRENTANSITLQIVNVFREPAALGRRRAQHIKDYLHTTWEIPESRIAISAKELSSPDGIIISKRPAIIINSTEPALLGPAVTQWLVDDYILPSVGLEKKIYSKLGVQDWKLTISQHGRQITQTSQDDFAGGDLNGIVPLGTLTVDSIPDPLIAELTATDFYGNIGTARDELALRVTNASQNPEREVRIFYFFEPQAMCPTLAITNKVLIEKIISTTRNGAQITVTTGSHSDNAKWGAGRIAEEILTALNARAVHLSVLHMEKKPTELEPASSIPGRDLFEHSVRVMVEQQALTTVSKDQ